MAITEKTRIPFEPDWATHPGEILEEQLEARGLKQADLARRTGLNPKLISTICSLQSPISPSTALALESVLGMKAAVWTNLQANWELFEERKKRLPTAAQAQAFVDRFPVKELVEEKLLPKTSDVLMMFQALLDFLGVANAMAYEATSSRLAVSHREGKGADGSRDCVFAWLKLGERSARTLNLPAFSEEKFRSAVRSARKLTMKTPAEFWPVMTHECRSSGVALMLAKPFKGMKVYGSTYWLENGNAVIQLSLRHKTNDHFWFTFFHECGHVLLHPRRNFIDGGDGLQSPKEEIEANDFAETVCYGIGGASKLRAEAPRTQTTIKQFASEYGLHPGIVLGTLQHYREIPFNSLLNKMKERFDLVKSP